MSRLRARPSAPDNSKAMTAAEVAELLGMDAAKLSLLQECARPLPADSQALAAVIKSLPLKHNGPRPMDEAISTAGGVLFSELSAGLELKLAQGVFCAGEMLDWEVPTGGYLLNGCFASGRLAGIEAAALLKKNRD